MNHVSCQFCPWCPGNDAVLALPLLPHHLTILKCQENLMETVDEKERTLRHYHALHPRPETVRDPLFLTGVPFFDARDLLQVRYELIRRVQREGQPVAQVTRLFGYSRSAFYAWRAQWDRAGFIGLLPASPGPHGAFKLTEEVLTALQEYPAPNSPAELAQVLHQHLDLCVHPRSIERALARQRGQGKRGRP
jgi:transposase